MATSARRDPITGKMKWEVDVRRAAAGEPAVDRGQPACSCRTRAAICARSTPRTGKELWKHNNGQGHNGGIISYMAKGKQYIAVVTGWGGLAGDDYEVLFGEPFASMPMDQGALVVFGLVASLSGSQWAGAQRPCLLLAGAVSDPQSQARGWRSCVRADHRRPCRGAERPDVFAQGPSEPVAVDLGAGRCSGGRPRRPSTCRSCSRTPAAGATATRGGSRAAARS